MNDVVLAMYSDRLFMAAVGVYVLAMALHAAEYAALRSAQPTAAPAEAVAVGATTASPGAAVRTCPTRVPPVRAPAPTGSAGPR